MPTRSGVMVQLRLFVRSAARVTVVPAIVLAAVFPAVAATPAAVSGRSPISSAKPASDPGRIAGTIILSHGLASRRPRFRPYSDPGPGSTPPSKPASDLKGEYANVVVYLELDGAKVLASGPDAHPQKPEMLQRDEQFVPHVLPIVQGTTVEFPNGDEVFHNVFSLSGAKSFDLPKYPTGSSRSVMFPRVGIVNVFCHIHSDMSGIILVRDNPYFVTPDTSGNFALDDVPPGDYNLVVWHERIKPERTTVKVIAGQTTRVNFNIPLPQPVER